MIYPPANKYPLTKIATICSIVCSYHTRLFPHLYAIRPTVEQPKISISLSKSS